ncbi:MAG: V-type ATP synthase subunit I [Candidatus Hydrogenedentes bacterium]|nr:V-type ATP synthase subunit I [Candidatus Hydrogenedentota bacterium]
MAIDRMKKVAILCERSCVDRLFRELHRRGFMELVDAAAWCGDPGPLRHGEVNTENVDQHLQKINLVLNLLDNFAPESQSFIQGLAPVPLLVEQQELEGVLNQFDLEGVYRAAQELEERWRGAEHRRGEILSRLEELMPFEEIPIPVSDLRRPKWIRLLFGKMSLAALESLKNDPETVKVMMVEEIPPGSMLRANGGGALPKNAPRHVLAAYVPENEEAVRDLLARHGFEEVTLPDIPGKVRDRVRELKEELGDVDRTVQAVAEGARKLAGHRRALKVLRAYWESAKRLQQAHGYALQGRWTTVVTGYIRERDLPALREMLNREFPGVECVLEDPEPGEEVPVSLTEKPAAQPLKLLTRMFGLPSYWAFDPSPFMLVNFYVFFGICFSDAAYGLMLTAAAAYIAKRTRPFEGLNNFARLLFWAGVSTTVFGLLMGSFFGDLYKASFMPERNPLRTFMEACTVLDLQAKTIPALIIALLIGMANQFYGIGLKMYGAIRNNDWVTALSDGLTWMITLPGAAILAVAFLTGVPRPLLIAGAVMFIVGALGLVATQGRESKGIVGRVGVGVMSIYGIVGSYGLTAFLGDTMSYCRLLALGLTTGILAQSFNMIAGMLWDVGGPIGPILTVLVLVFTHLFNFLINALGAFVHSMRLLFVEWFGRFYEGGAKEFEPLGFDSPAAILKRN